MAWWVWLLIAFAGLVLVALALGAASQRATPSGQKPEREGPWSFVYYVLVDWWIDWL